MNSETTTTPKFYFSRRNCNFSSSTKIWYHFVFINWRYSQQFSTRHAHNLHCQLTIYNEMLKKKIPNKISGYTARRNLRNFLYIIKPYKIEHLSQNGIKLQQSTGKFFRVLENVIPEKVKIGTSKLEIESRFWIFRLTFWFWQFQNCFLQLINYS